MSGSLPKPEIEKKFEEYRHYLVYEATRLTSFVALFRKLHERRGDRLEEINIAPAFFQVVTEALLSGIVLWVDKLFDEHGKRSIFNFLTFVEYNRNILTVEQLKRRNKYPSDHWMLARDPISLKTVKEDRELILRLVCLQNFKTLRDKFYAHFDKEYFFDRDRMREMAPTWGDLEEVVKVISQVINRYSVAYDGREFLLEPENINDLDSLLDRLYKSRKANNC
ncbi:AbiU2 domain-containing protein [Nitrospira sp. T9]|uniref:AbiU2 domain-containing protein n=1 Tax=unclassified Nitrospira TaxID=2652172 RepID=UPI003F9D4D9E